MRAAWAIGISSCTLRGMGGCSEVNAECPVAVMVAALGSMMTVEKLMLASVDGGAGRGRALWR